MDCTSASSCILGDVWERIWLCTNIRNLFSHFLREMLPSSFDIQKNVAGSIEQTSTLSNSRPELNKFIMLGQFKNKSSYTLWTNKRPLETTIPNEWPCLVTQKYKGKNRIKVDELISINKNSNNHKIQFIKQYLTQLFFSWPMNHSAQKLFT